MANSSVALPLKACAFRGCRSLVRGATYCPGHTVQVERDRGHSAARGYGRRWRDYRLRWLSRHPLCGDRDSYDPRESASGCHPERSEGPPGLGLTPALAAARAITHSRCRSEGRYTLARVVDHIIPVRAELADADPLFWNPLNHQSLCPACHASKTRTERNR